MSAPEHGLYVVLSGTPADGFEVIGPFKHPSYAAEWAATWEDDIDWWVVPLIAQSAEETGEQTCQTSP